MKLIKVIASCSLLVCASTQAASFDCAKAESMVEMLICRDAHLSELDSQIGEAFQTAKQSEDVAGAKRLMADQRHWLRNTRNRCADVTCLVKSYSDRLAVLDPLFDKELTCQEMWKYPSRIFGRPGGIDLGSGHGSPIAVDYRCSESLSKQDFMQTLLALAEQVRGENGPPTCTGSIIHAHWRYYHFSLAEAGFSPRTLLKRRSHNIASIDWKVPQGVDGDGSAARTIRYFKQWSEMSPVNFGLYTDFTSEFDKALPILAAHYKHTFGLSITESQAAAQAALLIVLDRAAGSFPRDELQPESELVRMVRDGHASSREIQDELRSGPDNPHSVSEDEIYRALRVALINDRPLEVVSAIAESLPPTAIGRSRDKQEPLLSLALGSQDNLEYLLSKKTLPVDAANDFGKTALFYAIGASNHRAVDALLKFAADVNHAYKSAKELRPDDDECIYPGLVHTKRTPLMHAAQNSDVEMIKLLVEAGAHLNEADELGYNARDYAVLGKNQENETYLKSLGLAFGAPIYAPDKDTSVPERTIHQAVAIDGYVSKLLAAPGRQDILVAAVHPWDSLVAGSQHGLHLFSLADPGHPTFLSSVPGIYVHDFALSPDGKRAYVIEMANDKGRPNKKFGLSIFNIEDPRQPILRKQVEGDFMTMHLSPDGNALYLQERELRKPEFSRGLLVFDVNGDGAKLRCSNTFGDGGYSRPVFAYSFTSFPDEPLLLIQDQSRQTMLFDVSDPCAPRRLSEFRAEDLSTNAIGLASRTIVAHKEDLGIFRITDSLVRLAGYQATVGVFDVNPRIDVVNAAISNDIAVFRIKSDGKFVLSDRYRLPVSHVGSLYQANTGYTYVGWKGGIGVGQIPLQ